MDDETLKTEGNVEDVKEETPPETEELEDLKRTNDKLNKRVKRLTANKHSLEEKIKELQDEQHSDISENEDEKDKRIAELEKQIFLSKSKSKIDNEFKKAGIVANTEILDLLISSDEEKTDDNVDLFVDFVKRLKEQTKQELLKGGTTPKSVGDKPAQVDLSNMSLLERSQLLKNNPNEYNKYFG